MLLFYSLVSYLFPDFFPILILIRSTLYYIDSPQTHVFNYDQVLYSTTLNTNLVGSFFIFSISPQGSNTIFYTFSWVFLNSTLDPEKAMAPHSSTLAWKIPWMEEPSRLQSMGSLRVGHDWVTSLSLFTFMHWRRTWQPTPVFLPGESQGWGSLVGCRLWGLTESDTTEVT